MCPSVHDEDFIFRFLIDNPVFNDVRDAVRYYFSDGRKSAQQLSDYIERLGVEVPEGKKLSVLEFASGYGCVTRHVKNVFSDIDWTACDIHDQANAFVKEYIGENSRSSSSVPSQLSLGRKFDVTFALSFFSHMPERTWGLWLKELYKHTAPGGLLVFSTQGLGSKKFLGDPAIPENGFWFLPDSEQKDLDVSEYGQTVVTFQYVKSSVNELLGQHITIYEPESWWGHQDTYVIKKPLV